MSDPDSLLLLRASVLANDPPSLTPTESLDTAHSLLFPPLPPQYPAATTIPLNTLTRFIKDNAAVDLRSIYFAWQQREATITEYLANAQSLGVTHLGFMERLELVTYLEGGQEEGEGCIRPIEKTQASTAAGSAGASKAQTSLVGKVRQTDPRLTDIYNAERVIMNRNVMLRGIKPTDFSHVRKQSEDFITRLRNANKPSTSNLPTRPSRPPPPSSRRRDPIILLSPSASSLLTMSNIKPFLEEGTFVPATSGSDHPNFLRVSRLLPNIHPTTPIRFDVVDSPDKFKPDYWEKVVAVFTTGQEWQFRSYKWSNPVELFRETRGFYVGYEGEQVPELVMRWGTGVSVLKVERGRRFRDREVCEKFWEGVEGWMKGKGWGR
ncbi:RNA pol II accessory factor, Cdc73 family-domain-containing protein [Pyronema domesticum]|uniref:Similar to Cell division control protein 73 acc. no. Q9UUE7 n=1 Tax=Pyronema omphalodes (strain CBS 100304) TaxID=1076935 RepID=U4LA93_PYROM|nr:RNA pol II accessory factor, Cdc73 family-domain-containing protein [Pyronema domesticum]CCX16307.1 Similar to Cell division control protein 73; acc. no. Q9UUE7 [Pyronema omphalodes CBS 100304]